MGRFNPTTRLSRAEALAGAKVAVAQAVVARMAAEMPEAASLAATAVEATRLLPVVAKAVAPQ